MATLFTVGHGTRSIEELGRLLKEAGVEFLVDVRRFPGSKRHPQFAKDRLVEDLPRLDIEYEWRGEELGGRRSRSHETKHPAWQNVAFQAYADHMDGESFRRELERLENEGAKRPLALMCAETLWWRCHRRLIADALAVRNHHVLHIMGPGKTNPHRISAWARRTEDGWVAYDAKADELAHGAQAEDTSDGAFD